MKKFTEITGKKLAVLHFAILASVVVGAFLVEWTLPMTLLSVVFYYAFMVVGVGVVMHRYYAHKSFEFRNKFLKYLFTFISIIACRASPLAWVYVHRLHHAHADTEKDPHRPDKLRLFSFREATVTDLKIFVIRDMLSKDQKVIHDYYFLFLFAWIILLAIINPTLIYFAWLLPAMITQIVQDVWNYYAHIPGNGYVNFSTTDNSRNVGWLWPFIFGEAWHNNHHKNPLSIEKNNWWEFDPVVYLIALVRK